jgi:hypothetical protein
MNHALKNWHHTIEQIRLPNGKPLPKIRRHDLRHTVGTLMVDEGEELVVVQRTLGHARQSITADTYVGTILKAVRTASARYGRLLVPSGSLYDDRKAIPGPVEGCAPPIPVEAVVTPSAVTDEHRAPRPESALLKTARRKLASLPVPRAPRLAIVLVAGVLARVRGS